MKKVVFGSFLILSGMISTAILIASSMTLEWTVDDRYSVVWNLSRYGLTPIFYSFIAIAISGFLIALWGLFENNKTGKCSK